MGIFNKKEKTKKEGNEENREESRGGEEERKVKVKKIKDINSENRKRRKEPIRSWTKLDRIFVSILLLLTVGGSLFLTLSSRGYKLPNFPRIKVPKFDFFGEQTIILESSSEDKKRADEIMDEYNRTTNGLSGQYAMYVLSLKDDFSFGVNEGEIFESASLLKLPVMVGMYMEEENGTLDLDSTYKLKASDRVRGYGSLYGKPAGYEVTFREMLKLIGKESDDTAFNICKKILGEEKIERVINLIGMTNTNFQKNETTAKDTGLIFYELWSDKLLNKKNTNELLEYLTDTSFEKWLTYGIPENIRVSHVYAKGVEVVNDAGIVFSDPPYEVVIMSKDADLDEADRVIPKLSEIVYESLNR